MVSITLPSDLGAWAEVEVAHGYAASVDTLVADALAARRRSVEALRAKLDEGRRSQPLDGDAVLAELDAWIAEDEAAAG